MHSQEEEEKELRNILLAADSIVWDFWVSYRI